MTPTATQAAAVPATGLDATRTLAHHAATLPYEALPRPLVELTKRCILDTLGVTIGASALAPEGRILADYVQDLGGKPESTLFGFAAKAPAPWAVFVNGSLGHMLDFDDVATGGHPSIATVPVAFALAERRGGVSGRDLLVAIAAGTDIMARIENSITIPQWIMTEGWFRTQLLGYIAATATAGRLLGLDPAQMENAFGIAFSQLAGSRQMAVGEATDLRSMQAGFSGQGGILAADLAQRGIIGSKEILEGRYGLYKTYVRDESPDWQALQDGLGRRFPILDTHGFKVWPSCAHTRPCTAAVLEIRESGVRPEQVESIVVIGGSKATRLLSEPIDAKRRPQTSIDAKYSIPFTSAVAMVTGNVTLRDYSEAGRRDPAVLAMADRVSYRAVPDKDNPSLIPVVEIRTKDGTLHRRQIDKVPGGPAAPIGWDRVEAKFRDCMAFSAKPITAADLDRAIRLVAELETVEDATAVIRLLG